MPQNNKTIVGITQGDSNGIGYEVIIKALSDERILDQLTPVIYGSTKLFNFYCKTIPEIEKLNVCSIRDASEVQPKKINIVECLTESAFAEPGTATPGAAQDAIDCLQRAVEDIKAGKIDVLVTGPINKKSMSAQGFKFPGHTEYLQHEFGVKDVTMLMVSNRIKLGVVTGHIPLKNVPSSISEESIISKLTLMKESLQKDFSITEPTIGVLSLNPHSGDGGLLGTEEQDIIIPALKKAIDKGIKVFGPFSPDGYFGLGTYQKFDATLAMYHDQGLSPFKTIAFADGINYTAGLPIVRTSPDHGTAFELAGRDLSDASSMRSAIYDAVDIYRQRKSNEVLQKGKMKDLRPTEEERPSNRAQIA